MCPTPSPSPQRRPSCGALQALFLAAVLLGTATQGGPAPVLRVPDGYRCESAAPDTALRFPMFACLDDTGRLFVAESSGDDLYAGLQQQTRECRISVLDDADDDGVFESSRVFADKLVFPMGLAWRDGRLYAADPPDLVTLEDTDHDGRADRRTVLITGFGHTDNGSLHGLVFGPDGWLYFTLGEPDGYRLTRRDGVVVSGTTGALFRCRPDGADLEVLSSGFANLVEIAFLPEGEILGTLNWYSLPDDGVRDALVHLVEGGRYPLSHEAPVTPPLFHGEPLPAVTRFPAVALSGLECWRGDTFPGAAGHLFSAQFNTRRIVRHEPLRAGATFRTVEHDFVTSDDPDVHFSDVLQDSDGSLLAVDTGSWYVHHCPTGRIRQQPAMGGLWRVRHRATPPIADRYGRRLDWKTPDVAELVRRLEDPRLSVQDRARRELERRPESASALSEVLVSRRIPAVQAAALWTLGNQATPAGRVALRDTLNRAESPLALLAARVLSRQPEAVPEERLMRWLTEPQPERRLAAAEALARGGSAAATGPLLAAVADAPDPILDHALLFALHRVAPLSELHRALKQPSPAVQRAALILLDQPERRALPPAALMERLDSPDPRLALTAQRLLGRHPEWAPEARGVVERLLEQDSLTAGQERLLSGLAGRLNQDPDTIAALARPLMTSAAVPRQTRALTIMTEVAPKSFPAAWSNALVAALTQAAPEVRRNAVKLMARQPPAPWTNLLARVADDETEAPACRLEALRPLVPTEPRLTPARFAFLERALAGDAVLRLSAWDVFTSASPSEDQIQRVADLTQRDPVLAPAPLIARGRAMNLTAPASVPLVNFAIQRLRGGWTLPDEQLVWLTAQAEAAGGTWPEALRSARDTGTRPLSDWLPLLTGGDAERGRRVFEGRAACASCHRVGGAGGTVGPDLTRIGSIRAGRDLLESIVAPSASFAQRYDPFTATLPDGTTILGVRVPADGAAVVLRDAAGQEIRLPADAVLVRSPISLMPQGLLQALDSEEARDLLAYVQSLK